MPEPASMLLREFGSPVTAQPCCGSDGAMASMPIEITRLSSNSGRQVTPLFCVFQMPPPAVATKNVFDGLGIPTMSDVRPSKFAGPSARHFIPATDAESIVCAEAAAPKTSEAPASTERMRLRGIALSDDGGIVLRE